MGTLDEAGDADTLSEMIALPVLKRLADTPIDAEAKVEADADSDEKRVELTETVLESEADGVGEEEEERELKPPVGLPEALAPAVALKPRLADDERELELLRESAGDTEGEPDAEEDGLTLMEAVFEAVELTVRETLGDGDSVPESLKYADVDDMGEDEVV